ncbi:hypothetical protein NC653_000691 [Populus alba x Populus x berolinensis]|uniref:NADH dehydrogenase [ubiquinone] 1 alpha subcomplex subunit 13 n=1 Tax=Populus alba x Populus x berolinensis TaxID=444605 RepID=A0AAD6WF43_9ROSI|nr:hypothetical protein NC653_000691 [Populus alba x Populus x berolinensis]
MTEAVIRNKPGMASVKDMPILQDGPPPGGFAPVRFARRIPSKGPSAMAIFLAAFGAFSYGMYEVGKGNKIRSFDEETLIYHVLSKLFGVVISGTGGKVKDYSCERASVLLMAVEAVQNPNYILLFDENQPGQTRILRSYALGLLVFSFLRALKEEKYAARRAILPLLQAEEDERFVKEWKKYLEYEAEVMKDVPGWKVGESVYNSGRWMPPATGELRPEVW